MTEQSPDEKQYVITGFQLNQLREHADLDFVCQAIRSRPLSNELKKERDKTMDKFGTLHGEDAIRFHKYLNSQEPLNQRAQEIVRQSKDLVAAEKKMVVKKMVDVVENPRRKIPGQAMEGCEDDMERKARELAAMEKNKGVP